MVKAVAEIAVNVPLERLFHYEVPERLQTKLRVGHRVLVPFGPRTTTGVCVGLPATTDIEKLKPIRELLHPDCFFDAHLLAFTRWIADYYQAGWGEVLEAALPPSVRSGATRRQVAWITADRPAEELNATADRVEKKAPVRARLLRLLALEPGPHERSALLQRADAKSGALKWFMDGGWVTLETRDYERTRPNVDLDSLESRSGDELHPDQCRALEAFDAALEKGGFAPFLIHGVTGSGKTEVYIEALRRVFARGQRGLVLVPEISLTPQTVLRFRRGFEGASVAVLHSMLSESERRTEWKAIHRGDAQLVIGARSAVFAPIRELGLIVVDEEHEPSYKQESSPRYSGRDAAVVRAHMLGIPVLLGSATPSLETFANGQSQKYGVMRLPRRVTSHPLPTITTATLDNEFYRSDGSGLISGKLDRLIRKRLQSDEQVLLFLNRRGFATYVHCVRCGYVAHCSECDITLTFHRGESSLRCHYCGQRLAVPPECPDCQMPHLRRSGVGTEKIFHALQERHENARIARLDRDTIRTQDALEETLGKFGRGEYDILVGTQMIAKGHDFPNVTLVGIVNADTGLHFPDFRAAERTYQLITQVAGRAGRGARAGHVIVQTFHPEHYAIRCAVSGDEEEFYRREVEVRQSMGYPPFGFLTKLLVQGKDSDKVENEATRCADLLRQEDSGCQILGPVPAPIAKVQGRHRFQVLVKSNSRTSLHDVVAALRRQSKSRRGGVEVQIDVDPYSML